MDKTGDAPRTDPAAGDTVGSEDLATLIVDALLSAGIVKQADVQRAIAIAIEEIEAQEASGDD